MTRIRRHHNDSGIALVITLIILVLLAGMAVALLQTATFERGTSSSIAAKTKSDLAAQAAADAAIASLVDKITQYPDSTTTWETINGNDGTVLYYHDKTPEQAIATGTSASTAILYVFPLTSGGMAVTADHKSSSIPVLTDTPVATANAYNLNHARSSGDTQGWIGSSPPYLSNGSPTTPQPFRGQWINLTDYNGAITGRYAYWMEDESFKANANLMTDTPRGSTSLGKGPNEIPFQGVLAAVLSSGSGNDAIATSIVGYRNSFPNGLFFNYRDINQVSGQATLADTMKFESTIFSGGLSLSRSGSKRVNLNAVVATTNDPTAIRKQLDQIIGTIRTELPYFGQRFYTASSGVSTTDATIYLNKIAANIRDYIDTDSLPTIVNNDNGYTVNISNNASPPMHSIPAGGASGTNEVIAIGKERGPHLQEYLLRVKEVRFSAKTGPSANYTVEIDHYLEFWNMTTRDIAVADLGDNPFFRIANQFAWRTTSGGGLGIPEDPSRDFSVPLNTLTNANGENLVFRAGMATVLTTDPTPLPGPFGVDQSRVFHPPVGTPANQYRVFSGVTTYKSSSDLRITAQTRPSLNGYDTETELILGNDHGIIESFGAPTVDVISVNVDDGTSPGGQDSAKLWTSANTCPYHFRGSSLKGNASGFGPTVSQKGDPRTNNEQLSLNSSSSVGDDQTAYKNELNSTNLPNYMTLTKLNSNFVDSTNWTDKSKNVSDANDAPSVIANSQLLSIGQLGDVFDAVRYVGVSNDIHYSRGGGRTFKIGQPERFDSNTNPDGLWDGDPKSASHERTAWRLIDLFSTSNAIQLPGVININGINRDAGAALKTTLYQYAFQAPPDSDPAIAGQNLAEPQIGALIAQAKAHLDIDAGSGAFGGPFFERGELSEMPLFNSTAALTGSDMSQIDDRGREELFRRLSELITTRGNVFTVYAVGQTLIPQPGAGAQPIIASTSQLKVTFRLDPIWATNPQTDPNWDPTNASDLNTRLARPTRYVAHILYAGD